MPEFFLELFSEEIPARMQARAAEELARLVGEALAPIRPENVHTDFGPRRIALGAEVAAGVEGSHGNERGPRANAPEAALAGFLRKHGATRAQLRLQGDHWVLERASEAVAAATLIAAKVPPLLRRFPWPKSMRWGGTSAFAWVRPLHRITCLLDGEVVPFDLRDSEDDGHGLASGNQTEGHRFLSPGAFAVRSREDWAEKLRARHVLVDAAERKRVIVDGVAALAAEQQLAVVDDPGLLDEVTGLVEWPVPLLGRIDPAYMDLPPEVMQVSMRANQRYFALRTPAGKAAPFFAFVANTEPVDGGRITISGNERVLRARFADARHFWDLDRRTPLAERVPALDAITFHAKLGSQGDRVRRLERLSELIAPLVGADPALARRAAHLAKADLVSGMVGEFPELQGVMGRYYALHDGEPPAVADAVRDHYAPKGPSDPAPGAPVSIAVGLADKLDTLAGFFAIGEKPTGSGDPYALRRSALGVIRTIRDNDLRLHLLPLLDAALDQVKVANTLTLKREVNGRQVNLVAVEIMSFLAERLRIQLRVEGARHDVLAAIFDADVGGLVLDDVVELLARMRAVSEMLASPAGADLLTGYRRASSIVSKEEARDRRTYHQDFSDELLEQPEERTLGQCVRDTGRRNVHLLDQGSYEEALKALASLREPLDHFFDRVKVNAEDADLRQNRLRLLSQLQDAMDMLANFSDIEA